MKSSNTPRLLGGILCRGHGEIEGNTVLIAPSPGVRTRRGKQQKATLIAALYLYGGMGPFQINWTLMTRSGQRVRMHTLDYEWPEGEIGHSLFITHVFDIEFPEDGLYRLVYLCDGEPLITLGFSVEFPQG